MAHHLFTFIAVPFLHCITQSTAEGWQTSVAWNKQEKVKSPSPHTKGVVFSLGSRSYEPLARSIKFQLFSRLPHCSPLHSPQSSYHFSQGTLFTPSTNIFSFTNSKHLIFVRSRHTPVLFSRLAWSFLEHSTLSSSLSLCTWGSLLLEYSSPSPLPGLPHSGENRRE